MDALSWSAGALLALVVIAVATWALRDKLDLIAEHGRDAARHALAFILMLGTLAGTVWTFSAGRLSLSGNWETVVSVGGIAAALEMGVVYTGWYIGQLDQRIRSTKRADDKAQLLALRGELMKWFYAVATISGIANTIYRTQALDNFPLALFISAAPIVLVILFCIKLRPLPQDYAEIGRISAQRGLVLLSNQAQKNFLKALRKIGNGRVLSDAEKAQLAVSMSIIRIHTTGEQAQALDHVIAQQAASPLALEAPGGLGQHGEGVAGGQWLTSADVVRLYDISERAAQGWIAATPGRRKRKHSTAWEAPAANVYAAHGVPAIADTAGFGAPAPRRRRRNQSQSAEEETPSAAETAQLGAVATPIAAEHLQLAVFQPSTSDVTVKELRV